MKLLATARISWLRTTPSRGFSAQQPVRSPAACIAVDFNSVQASMTFKGLDAGSLGDRLQML